MSHAAKHTALIVSNLGNYIISQLTNDLRTLTKREVELRQALLRAVSDVEENVAQAVQAVYQNLREFLGP